MKNIEYFTMKNSILNAACACSVCKKTEAHDIHILKHYEGDELTLDDIIPVCSDCQKLINLSIDSGYINPKKQAVSYIKTEILDLYQDAEFRDYYNWFTSKHFLTEELLQLIKTSTTFVIRRIAQMMKKKIWYDNIHTYKFTGKQIMAIRRIIKTELYRKNKLQ